MTENGHAKLHLLCVCVCVFLSLSLTLWHHFFCAERKQYRHTRAMRHQPRSQETPASLVNKQHIIRATYMWLESVPIMASWLLMIPPCPPVYLSACVLCLFLCFVFPAVTRSAYLLVCPSPSFPVFLFLPVCLNLLVCLSLSDLFISDLRREFALLNAHCYKMLPNMSLPSVFGLIIFEVIQTADPEVNFCPLWWMWLWDL